MFYSKKDGPPARLLPASLRREKKHIAGFRRGNEADFAWLYRRFRKPIHRYIGTKIRDEGISEELTQEVFLKAFRFRESFELRYEFSTWLWTIARNTVIDWSRTKGLPMGSGSEAFDPDQIVDPAPCAEGRLLERSEREHLMEVMKSLTELQRQALLLRVIHRLSYHEIARQLGLSLGAVKGLLFRAKETLGRVVHPDHRRAEDIIIT
ncbi:MAG: RNA polymerase sigma factor [Bdellovibrionota bacterium]